MIYYFLYDDKGNQFFISCNSQLGNLKFHYIILSSLCQGNGMQLFPYGVNFSHFDFLL
jgi:hypothetical protein